MNAFVIAVGSYVKSLSDLACEIGAKISEVTVDVRDTAFKVRYAPNHIEKAKKNAAALARKRRR
jgi:hypothetical protein